MTSITTGRLFSKERLIQLLGAGRGRVKGLANQTLNVFHSIARALNLHQLIVGNLKQREATEGRSSRERESTDQHAFVSQRIQQSDLQSHRTRDRVS